MTVRLSLPKGDFILPDNRRMRVLIGYDVRKAPGINRVTREGILESRGWRHDPTTFIITATVDLAENKGPLVHVSMSYPDKDPSWEEIKWVRSIFIPDWIDAMMVLPRKEDYVNLHPHCFHVWQMPETWGIL